MKRLAESIRIFYEIQRNFDINRALWVVAHSGVFGLLLLWSFLGSWRGGAGIFEGLFRRSYIIYYQDDSLKKSNILYTIYILAESKKSPVNFQISVRVLR